MSDQRTTTDMIRWLQSFMPLEGGMIEAIIARLREADKMEARWQKLREWVQNNYWINDYVEALIYSDKLEKKMSDLEKE